MQPELIHFPTTESWAFEIEVKRKPIIGFKPVKASEPESVAKYLYKLGLAEDAQEQFVMLALDTKNQVIGHCQISKGLLDRAHVHCREVFRPAIVHGTAKIIIAHNHPSGDLTPSRQDREVTDNLRSAGEIIGIEIIDHLIVGHSFSLQSPHYLSFRQEGFISSSNQQAA